MLIDDLLKQIMITQRELLAFVLTFGRLEYALKRSGVFAKGGSNSVQADWDKFGRELAPNFDPERTKELSDAVMYLENAPPLKQVLRDGALDFDLFARRCGEPLLVQLFDSIRVARNNLFHGGKFQHGPVDDPARNAEVLSAASRILEECLELCHQSESHNLRDVHSKFVSGLDYHT